MLLKIYNYLQLSALVPLKFSPCQIAVCADWLYSSPRLTNVSVETVTSSEMKMFVAGPDTLI